MASPDKPSSSDEPKKPESGESEKPYVPSDSNELIIDEVMEYAYRERRIDQGKAQTRFKLGDTLPSRRLPPERIEKLSKLRPRLLTLNPEDPENSPDLKQIENLYNKNLIPDEAFKLLESKDERAFERAVERGAMLNHFDPSPEELENYPADYETVKQQVISDMLGTSKRRGTYHFMGLFDSSDILRASLSFRLPPKRSEYKTPQKYGRHLAKYKQYLERTLINADMIKNKEMWYTQPDWRLGEMRSELHKMFEIDTINVEKGWGGAGLMVVRDALQFIKDRLGEIPQATFIYRFNGIIISDEDKPDHKYAIGKNRGSRAFFEDLGFEQIAERRQKDEVVIRKYGQGCHLFNPEWAYDRVGRNRFQRRLAQCMREAGILKPDEPLFS